MKERLRRMVRSLAGGSFGVAAREAVVKMRMIEVPPRGPAPAMTLSSCQSRDNLIDGGALVSSRPWVSTVTSPALLQRRDENVPTSFSSRPGISHPTDVGRNQEKIKKERSTTYK